MSTQIIAIVDAPEVSLSKNDMAGDALLKFYRALGWNGMDKLYPWKVCTTNEVFDYLYSVIYDGCHDSMAVGILMVNTGPSTDKHIPPGKVYLYEGWVTPTESKEAL